MSNTSFSSRISSPLSLSEGKHKKNSDKENGSVKSFRQDSVASTMVSLPRLDTHNKRAVNNEAVKRWGRAERRLTIVSFPKILNERKKRYELEREAKAFKDRKERFLESLKDVPKGSIKVEKPPNYFNSFSHLYFDVLPYINLSTPDEMNIDSKKYISTFKQYYDNYQNIEDLRKCYFDNYNINVIRKRQFIELEDKIEKNEVITQNCKDITDNLNENELICSFNNMTDQFANLAFKLCHLSSIRESKNIRSMIEEENKIIQSIAVIQNENEKKIDHQLNDIEYQIKEAEKDIDKILKLLNND
uniref:Uncharacterized protein n=1 Tax=Parastrongyloides trichosuri TaxID=131310 RepID=A0A0N5A3X4_PARTI